MLQRSHGRVRKDTAATSSKVDYREETAVVTAKNQTASHGSLTPTEVPVAAFHDFSIALQRVDAHKVAVKVQSAPAGALHQSITVALSASEAEKRSSFPTS
jgi:hypothetical protein